MITIYNWRWREFGWPSIRNRARSLGLPDLNFREMRPSRKGLVLLVAAAQVCLLLFWGAEVRSQDRRKPWGRSPFQFMEGKDQLLVPTPSLEEQKNPPAEGTPSEETIVEYVPIEEKKFEPDISVIITSGDKRAALIDGRSYEVGDHIEDFEIVSIQADSVVFRKGRKLTKVDMK